MVNEFGGSVVGVGRVKGLVWCARVVYAKVCCERSRVRSLASIRWVAVQALAKHR